MVRKMFTLSFDDNTVQDERFIELIDKYNLRATFNINTATFGNKHNIIHEGIDVCHDDLEAEKVKYLYRNHEVALHTHSHPNLKKCADERIVSEIKENYDILTALTGKEIIGMAYPCGGDCYDERVMKVITDCSPVRYARTTNAHHTFALPENFMAWHPTCHQNDPALMELADKFIEAEPEEDILFYLWGHTFEFDKFKSWETFERFCEKIASRLDITYMTNGEVYRYVMRKRNLHSL